MRVSVVIVAGGVGLRMQNNSPKQFLMLDEKPVIVHSILAFAQTLPYCQVIVGMAEPYMQTWLSIKDAYLKNVNIETVTGGESRSKTVRNCLEKVMHEKVLIHDAARPWVSNTLIQQCVEALRNHNAVVPVIAVSDTVYNKNTCESIARENLYLAQTPQGFEATILKNIYQNQTIEFTDDAQAMQSNNIALHFINGDTGNIKITYSDSITKRLFPNQII